MRRMSALAAGLLLVSANTALAHPKLLSSTPAANSRVAPTQTVELQFSETLIAKLASADLVMTDMPGMKMASPTAVPVRTTLGGGGKSLTVTASKVLTTGTYKLAYHVTSTDTHRVNGGFTFRVK